MTPENIKKALRKQAIADRNAAYKARRKAYDNRRAQSYLDLAASAEGAELRRLSTIRQVATKKVEVALYQDAVGVRILTDDEKRALFEAFLAEEDTSAAWVQSKNKYHELEKELAMLDSMLFSDIATARTAAAWKPLAEFRKETV